MTIHFWVTPWAGMSVTSVQLERELWDALQFAILPSAWDSEGAPPAGGVPVAGHTLDTCILASSSMGIWRDFLDSVWVQLRLCLPPMMTNKVDLGFSVASVGHSTGTRGLVLRPPPPVPPITILCGFSSEAWLPSPPVDTVQVGKPTDCT